jgi:hypothetical protein
MSCEFNYSFTVNGEPRNSRYLRPGVFREAEEQRQSWHPGKPIKNTPAYPNLSLYPPIAFELRNILILIDMRKRTDMMGGGSIQGVCDAFIKRHPEHQIVVEQLLADRSPAPRIPVCSIGYANDLLHSSPVLLDLSGVKVPELV